VKERVRPRTVAEALDDCFIATAESAALSAVTVMAFEGLAATERRRLQLTEELPEIGLLLQGLLVNQAVQFAEIQRLVTSHVKRMVN